jgi:predicted lipoprotein with Yx(FWY)xxD motif
MAISSHWLAAVGLSTVLIAAGCASSAGGSSPASNPAGGGGQTVAVQTVSGTQVLVDSSGRSLYFSEQEKAAHKVLCNSSACQAIWTPLTVSAGQQPSGPASVAAKLGTMSRSGGVRQVTFNGAPLYTFEFDHSSGQLNGNGQKDSFDGTNFTWEAAAVSGTPAAPASSNPYGSGGGYGGGY